MSDMTMDVSPQAEGQLATGEAETAQAEGQVAPDEGTEESFDSLIKGKYKKEYNQKVKEAMSKRFRNHEDYKNRYNQLAPIIQMAAERYGMDASDVSKLDVDALMRAMSDDNSMYEEEAFKAGMDVAAYKQMKQTQRENMLLRQQQAEYERAEENRRNWQEIERQAEDARQYYPDLDLDVEMENEQFGRMIVAGVPVKAAYEAAHMNEIMGSGMQYAVQETSRKIANSIRSGARPSEGGTNPTAQVPKVDPSKLSLSDLAEIKRRASAGEVVTF